MKQRSFIISKVRRTLATVLAVALVLSSIAWQEDPVPVKATDGTVFWVSATDGDDESNSGTSSDSPFKTLKKAFASITNETTTVHIMTDMIINEPFGSYDCYANVTLDSDDGDPDTSDDNFMISPDLGYYNSHISDYMIVPQMRNFYVKNITFDGRVKGSEGIDESKKIAHAMKPGGSCNIYIQEGCIFQNFEVYADTEHGGVAIINVQGKALHIQAGCLAKNNIIHSGRQIPGSNGNVLFVVGSAGEFYFEGGEITGNICDGFATGMIGLGTNIDARISGGSIHDNIMYESDSYACYQRMENATKIYPSYYNFSGDAFVYNNKDTLGRQKNVYTPVGQTAYLNGGLSEKAHIGVYTDENPTEDLAVAVGRGGYYPVESDALRISIDKPTNLAITYNDSDHKIYLTPHTEHSWVYEKTTTETGEDMLTAHCATPGCAYATGSAIPTLSLSAISLDAGGTISCGDAKSASNPNIKISGLDYWTAVVGAPKIEFSYDDGETWSETTPSAIGSYSVRVYPASEAEAAGGPEHVLSDTFYALPSSGYRAYLIPHTFNSDGTAAETARPVSGSYTWYYQGSTAASRTGTYNGVKINVDGEIRYYYTTLEAAIEAAQAGKTNTGYVTSANPNGVIKHNDGTGYLANDSLNEELGKYTDTVMLLDDASIIYNFGASTYENKTDLSQTKYGIRKGIIIDLNGKTAGEISAGFIPEDETLVIKNGTIGEAFYPGDEEDASDAFDDEGGTGHLTGPLVFSDVNLDGRMWASCHAFYFLNGRYHIIFGDGEDPTTVKPRGGYYIGAPNDLGVAIDYDTCHVEAKEGATASVIAEFNDVGSDYTHRVVNGATSYNIVLNVNAGTDTVYKVGEAYTGETISNILYTAEQELPTLSREGYRFEGWNTSSGGTGTMYTTTAAGITTAHGVDVTLYAVWLPHTHSWNYYAGTGEDADKLYAYCTDSSAGTCAYYGTEESHENAISVALQAITTEYKGTHVTYSDEGEEADIKLIGGPVWIAEGLTVPNITYYTGEDCLEDQKTTTADGAVSDGGAPKNVGDYWVTAAVGTAVAKAAFSIEQGTPVFTTTPAAAVLTYTGSAQDLLSTYASTSNGDIKYAITLDGEMPEDAAYTETSVYATDAGIYYVFYMINGGENYSNLLEMTPVEVTIAKRPQTGLVPTCSAISATKMTVVAPEGGIGDVEYMAVLHGTTAPEAEDGRWQSLNVISGLCKLTDYDVYVKFSGDANNEAGIFGCQAKTEDMESRPIIGPVVIPTASEPGIIYDGEPIGPEEIFTGGPTLEGGGYSEVTYRYEGVAPTVYEETTTPPTDPGTYMLTIIMVNDDYYGELKIPFMIAKRPGPAAPEVGTVPSSYSGNDGKITGLDTDKSYEYSTDGSSWTDVSASASAITGLTALAPDPYYVRIKEDAYTKAGESAQARVLKKEQTPSVTPIYTEETLYGFTEGEKYYINSSDALVPGVDKKISVTNHIGLDVYIVKAGNDISTVNSDPQEMYLRRADAPTSLGTVNETVQNASDGKITGLISSKSYQYRLRGNQSWTDVTASSTEIPDLPGGIYEVRYAAGGGFFAGVPTIITVNTGTITPGPTPGPTPDPTSEPRYDVNGRVYDEASSSYANDIKVRIMKGNELFASGTTTTSAIDSIPGSYTFSAPNGTYNIVVTSPDGNRTTTKIITVEGASLTVEDITLPTATAQSKLTIDTTNKDTAGNEADFAETVVGGLDLEANAAKAASGSATSIKIEMRLTPQEPENVSTDAKTAIEEKTADMSKVEYVDIRVEKTINEGTPTRMSETTNVLQVIIPFDFTGKTNISVIRYHDGAAESFAENASHGDLTFTKDIANKLITLYTKKFSSYAVAYKNATVYDPGDDYYWYEDETEKKKEKEKDKDKDKDEDKDKNKDKDKDKDTKKKKNNNSTTTLEEAKEAVRDFMTDVKFDRLRAKSLKQTETSVTLEWNKVGDADGYFIYAAECNHDGIINRYEKIKTITDVDQLTYVVKDLKPGTFYKFLVKAYTNFEKYKIVIASAVAVHVPTKGGSYGAAIAVKVSRIGKVTYADNTPLAIGLTLGEKVRIFAEDVVGELPPPEDKHRKMCYESSDESVARVTEDGDIIAVGAGTCTIFVYAQNGVYESITVTVK